MLQHQAYRDLGKIGRKAEKECLGLGELLLQPQGSRDLGQKDGACWLGGRLGGSAKSCFRSSRIVVIPELIDLSLVRPGGANGLVQSAMKTKTSRMISAKSAVRYVIE